MFQNRAFQLYSWEVWRDTVPPRSFPFVLHCERRALAVQHNKYLFGGGQAAPKPPLNCKVYLKHALPFRE